MSANRSVQAAQRRRAGQPEPQVMSRPPPQPSINSSQVFSGQPPNMRQNSNPNSNPGRVSAQQYLSQGQGQQRQVQGEAATDGITGISKMTIAQAITLITLRLGALETKIIQIDRQPEQGGFSNEMGLDHDLVLIDKSALENITTRLESLEKRSQTSGGSGDNLVIKQQMDTMKNSLIQTKNSTVSLGKENKEIKQQVEQLFKELKESREIIDTINSLNLQNNQSLDYDEEANLQGEPEEKLIEDSLENDSDENDYVEEERDTKLMGAELKALLKNEINAEI